MFLVGARVMLVGVSVCDIVLVTPKLSEPGGIVYLERGVTISLGGHPCNIGVNLAKLGYNPREVFVVSAIGDDFCGLFLEQELSKYNLQLRFTKLRGVGSTKNVIVVVGNEDRRFHVEMGASALLPPSHVLSVLEEVKPHLLHLAAGVISRVDEDLTTVLSRARSLGVVTFVDVGAAKPHGRDSWDFLLSALNYVDIFHCNTHELRSFLGTVEVLEGVKEILSRGVKVVLVTEGERGAYVAKDNYALHQEAFKVTPVDPTGAGDAFQAGFIYKLAELHGEKLNSKVLEDLDANTLAQLLLYAQAAGAACVTAPGTTTAVTRENVERLIQEQGNRVLKSTRMIKISL